MENNFKRSSRVSKPVKGFSPDDLRQNKKKNKQSGHTKREASLVTAVKIQSPDPTSTKMSTNSEKKKSEDESKLGDSHISDDSAEDELDVFPELNQPYTPTDEVTFFEMWSNTYGDHNKKCEEIINKQAQGQMRVSIKC